MKSRPKMLPGKAIQRTPLFGRAGFAGQLGGQEYARDRMFREGIRRWLKLVCFAGPMVGYSLEEPGISGISGISPRNRNESLAQPLNCENALGACRAR